MIGADFAAALQPSLIMEEAGLPADPWQAELLDAWPPPKRAVIVASRQAGKSTTVAAVALHEALFGPPDGLVAIVSPSQPQSSEMARRVLALLGSLDPAPALDQVAVTSFTVAATGTRVLSLPGSAETIRGYSASLLVIDEAACVADDVMAAARPMLAATGGRLVALSTPAGRRGWFADAVLGNDPQWHRVSVTAADCPRLTPEFLEAERRALGDRRFRQEYLGEFTGTTNAVFTADTIDTMTDPTGDVLWGGRNPFDIPTTPGPRA